MDFSVIQYDFKIYNALYNRKHKQNNKMSNIYLVTHESRNFGE